jgi:hypothetical protein
VAEHVGVGPDEHAHLAINVSCKGMGSTIPFRGN